MPLSVSLPNWKERFFFSLVSVSVSIIISYFLLFSLIAQCCSLFTYLLYRWRIYRVMQPDPYVDYLPNSQNERRITPENHVRLYNKECI